MMLRGKNTSKLVITMLALMCVFSIGANAEPPVRSDSRIKTMVFNENEVYTIVTRGGFSTAIELSDREKIETISLGDSVGWQVTPTKNRIFIKPLLRNATTNLSVITNKRDYQFELVVSAEKIKNATHAYVVKFFYPDELETYVSPEDRTRGDLRPVSQTAIPEIPVIAAAPLQPVAPVSSAALAPVPLQPVYPAAAPRMSNLPSLTSIGIEAFNFNYTLTGPEERAPKKIFDDGRATYFEYDYPLNSVPVISVVSADGAESPVNVRADGKKYIVDTVSAKFVIREAGQKSEENKVSIFNEAMLSGGVMPVRSSNYQPQPVPAINPEFKAAY